MGGVECMVVVIRFRLNVGKRMRWVLMFIVKVRYSVIL